MDFVVSLVLVTIALLEAQGKNVDPRYQVLNNSSHLPPQPAEQRYATKEIILYLTPTQIRALQEGQGLINLPQVPSADIDESTQAYVQTHPQDLELYQNQFHPQQNGHLPPHLANRQPLETPINHAPQSDHFVPIVPPQDYRQPESIAHKAFQAQNQKRIPKPVPFFPDPTKEAPNNKPKALPAVKSQETLPDQNKEITRQQLKEQWIHYLNQNIAQFKALEAQNQREKSNDNKYVSDVYNLVRSHNEHRLEKQQALLQAEAIANSSPTLVHKEIHIKHIPAHVVPEPFKVKLSKEYEVPLEILRTLPIPIVKTNEVDRPVPVEIEKHIPLHLTKNVYNDRPFFLDHVVPLESPLPYRGSSPIHSHEWHH